MFDDYIYVVLEVGVFGDVMFNVFNVVFKGCFGLGMMIYVDLETGEFKENTEIAKEVFARFSYGEWMKVIDCVKGIEFIGVM